MARLKMFKLQRIITAGYGVYLCATIQFRGQRKHSTLIDLVHSLLEPHHRVLRHKPVNTLGKIQHARLRVFGVV